MMAPCTGFNRGFSGVWVSFSPVIPGYSGLKQEQKGLKTSYKPGGKEAGEP